MGSMNAVRGPQSAVRKTGRGQRTACCALWFSCRDALNSEPAGSPLPGGRNLETGPVRQRPEL